MTAEEFKEKYFLATGIEIDDETAALLLKEEGSPWFKKIVKMAEPTVWADLAGEYNVKIEPVRIPASLFINPEARTEKEILDSMWPPLRVKWMSKEELQKEYPPK